jgi:hypothetical protein
MGRFDEVTLSMRRRLRVLALMAFVGGAAAAQGAERWSIAAQGGTDVEVSGDVLLSGQGSLAGLTAAADSLSYRGAFGRSFRGAVSIGCRLSPRLEVFARGGRYSMNGRSVRIGSASGLDLMAEVGPYHEWTAEAGLRRFFATRGAFEPYVAVVGGVRSLEAMALSLGVPDANLSAPDLSLYDESTVVVVGADGGVLWRVSSHAFVGVEAGLRYQAAPTGLDAGLQGSGLEAINDGGSRWSLPVSAQVGLRF